MRGCSRPAGRCSRANATHRICSLETWWLHTIPSPGPSAVAASSLPAPLKSTCQPLESCSNFSPLHSKAGDAWAVSSRMEQPSYDIKLKIQDHPPPQETSDHTPPSYSATGPGPLTPQRSVSHQGGEFHGCLRQHTDWCAWWREQLNCTHPASEAQAQQKLLGFAQLSTTSSITSGTSPSPSNSPLYPTQRLLAPMMASNCSSSSSSSPFLAALAPQLMCALPFLPSHALVQAAEALAALEQGSSSLSSTSSPSLPQSCSPRSQGSQDESFSSSSPAFQSSQHNPAAGPPLTQYHTGLVDGSMFHAVSSSIPTPGAGPEPQVQQHQQGLQSGNSSGNSSSACTLMVVEAIMEACELHLGTLTAPQLLTLLVALARLRVAPSKPWMATALHQLQRHWPSPTSNTTSSASSTTSTINGTSSSTTSSGCRSNKAFGQSQHNMNPPHLDAPMDAPCPAPSIDQVRSMYPSSVTLALSLACLSYAPEQDHMHWLLACMGEELELQGGHGGLHSSSSRAQSAAAHEGPALAQLVAALSSVALGMGSGTLHSTPPYRHEAADPGAHSSRHQGAHQGARYSKQHQHKHQQRAQAALSSHQQTSMLQGDSISGSWTTDWAGAVVRALPSSAPWEGVLLLQLLAGLPKGLGVTHALLHRYPDPGYKGPLSAAQGCEGSFSTIPAAHSAQCRQVPEAGDVGLQNGSSSGDRSSGSSSGNSSSSSGRSDGLGTAGGAWSGSSTGDGSSGSSSARGGRSDGLELARGAWSGDLGSSSDVGAITRGSRRGGSVYADQGNRGNQNFGLDSSSGGNSVSIGNGSGSSYRSSSGDSSRSITLWEALWHYTGRQLHELPPQQLLEAVWAAGKAQHKYGLAPSSGWTSTALSLACHHVCSSVESQPGHPSANSTSSAIASLTNLQSKTSPAFMVDGGLVDLVHAVKQLRVNVYDLEVDLSCVEGGVPCLGGVDAEALLPENGSDARQQALSHRPCTQHSTNSIATTSTDLNTQPSLSERLLLCIEFTLPSMPRSAMSRLAAAMPDLVHRLAPPPRQPHAQRPQPTAQNPHHLAPHSSQPQSQQQPHTSTQPRPTLASTHTHPAGLSSHKKLPLLRAWVRSRLLAALQRRLLSELSALCEVRAVAAVGGHEGQGGGCTEAAAQGLTVQAGRGEGLGAGSSPLPSPPSSAAALHPAAKQSTTPSPQQQVGPSTRQQGASAPQQHQHQHQHQRSTARAPLGPMVPEAWEIATWLQALAALSPSAPHDSEAPQQQQVLHMIMDAGLVQLPRCSNQELVDITASMARLGCRPSTAWLQELGRVSGHRLRKMEPLQIAVLVWAMARLQAGRHLPSPWLHQLHRSSASSLPALSPRYLAQLAWGAALLLQQQQQQQDAHTQELKSHDQSQQLQNPDEIQQHAQQGVEEVQQLPWQDPNSTFTLTYTQWLFRLLDASATSAFRQADAHSLSTLAWAVHTLLEPPAHVWAALPFLPHLRGLSKATRQAHSDHKGHEPRQEHRRQQQQQQQQRDLAGDEGTEQRVAHAGKQQRQQQDLVSHKGSEQQVALLGKQEQQQDLVHHESEQIVVLLAQQQQQLQQHDAGTAEGSLPLQQQPRRRSRQLKLKQLRLLPAQQSQQQGGGSLRQDQCLVQSEQDLRQQQQQQQQQEQQRKDVQAAQQLLHEVQAWAKLLHHLPSWRAKLCTMFEHRLATASPRSVASTVWAVSELVGLERRWAALAPENRQNSTAVSTNTKVSSCGANNGDNSSSSNSSSSGGKGLHAADHAAVAAWALRCADALHSESTAGEAFKQREANTQDLANTVTALARLGAQPSLPWLKHHVHLTTHAAQRAQAQHQQRQHRAHQQHVEQQQQQQQQWQQGKEKQLRQPVLHMDPTQSLDGALQPLLHHQQPLQPKQQDHHHQQQQQQQQEQAQVAMHLSASLLAVLALSSDAYAQQPPSTAMLTSHCAANLLPVKPSDSLHPTDAVNSQPLTNSSSVFHAANTPLAAASAPAPAATSPHPNPSSPPPPPGSALLLQLTQLLPAASPRTISEAMLGAARLSRMPPPLQAALGFCQRPLPPNATLYAWPREMSGSPPNEAPSATPHATHSAAQPHQQALHQQAPPQPQAVAASPATPHHQQLQQQQQRQHFSRTSTEAPPVAATTLPPSIAGGVSIGLSSSSSSSSSSPGARSTSSSSGGRSTLLGSPRRNPRTLAPDQPHPVAASQQQATPAAPAMAAAPAAPAAAVAVPPAGLLRQDLREVVGSLLLASHRRMHAMDGCSLATCAWALASMAVRPSPRWLDRFQAAAFQQACQGNLGMRERAMMLWAAARGGWPLHPDFVGSLLPGPSLIGSADLCDLGMVVWGVAHLQAGAPSRGLLGAVLVVSARELMCTFEAAVAGGDMGGVGGRDAQDTQQQQQQQQQKERGSGNGVADAWVGHSLGTVERDRGAGKVGKSSYLSSQASPRLSSEASSMLPQAALSPPPTSHGMLPHMEACLMLAQGLLTLGARPPSRWWRLWLASACVDLPRMSLQHCCAVLWVVAAAGGGDWGSHTRGEAHKVRGGEEGGATKGVAQGGGGQGVDDEGRQLRRMLRALLSRCDGLLRERLMQEVGNSGGGSGGGGGEVASSSAREEDGGMDPSSSSSSSSGRRRGSGFVAHEPAMMGTLVGLAGTLATLVRRVAKQRSFSPQLAARHPLPMDAVRACVDSLWALMLPRDGYGTSATAAPDCQGATNTKSSTTRAGSSSRHSALASIAPAHGNAFAHMPTLLLVRLAAAAATLAHFGPQAMSTGPLPTKSAGSDLPSSGTSPASSFQPSREGFAALCSQLLLRWSSMSTAQKHTAMAAIKLLQRLQAQQGRERLSGL